jgi:hypothetical protein
MKEQKVVLNVTIEAIAMDALVVAARQDRHSMETLVNKILSEWLIAKSYLPRQEPAAIPIETLNASNDE